MHIKEIPVAHLRPYEKNPRINDHVVKNLAQIIAEFGFQVPLVIDANKTIITGHTRWKAAQLLGFETVPCVVAESLTKEQAQQFRIIDNKISEKARWDYPLLQAELEEIGFDNDILSLAFDQHEMDVLTQADFNPTPAAEDPASDVKVKLIELTLTEEQYEVFRRAKDKIIKVVDEEDVTDGRALELICAEFLA